MEKEKLEREILKEIEQIKAQNRSAFSTQQSEAILKVAISNLYIALSNLQK